MSVDDLHHLARRADAAAALAARLGRVQSSSRLFHLGDELRVAAASGAPDRAVATVASARRAIADVKAHE